MCQLAAMQHAQHTCRAGRGRFGLFAYCADSCFLYCLCCAVSPEQYKSVLSEAGFEEELLCPVPTNLSDKNRAGMEWLGIWRRRA